MGAFCAIALSNQKLKTLLISLYCHSLVLSMHSRTHALLWRTLDYMRRFKLEEPIKGYYFIITCIISKLAWNILGHCKTMYNYNIATEFIA